MSNNLAKETIAACINEADDALAFNLLVDLGEKEVECSESECDSCPIVKSLIAKGIQPSNHAQYPTCNDFMDHIFYDTDCLHATRASEASVMERSDIGEGTYVTEPNKI